MSVECRLAKAEKAAAASHVDVIVYAEILENPNFYGNAERLGLDDTEPRILSNPDWYGEPEGREGETDPDGQPLAAGCGCSRPGEVVVGR